MMRKRRSTVISRLFLAVIFIFLYAPIFVLITFSFNSSKSRTQWAGFTLDWYAELFNDASIMNAFSTTLLVSLLAAAIATVFGTVTALGFYCLRKRWRSPLMAVNNIPLTNADIVTGVSLCLLFVFFGSRLKFSLGFGTLLVAHITFNVPYVLLSVMPKLYQLDRSLIDAAQDLGCTPARAFLKVTVPELMPGIINGAIIAFTMSIDDFVISYFTAGSTVSTLSMTIYAMTRRRVTPKINAISSLLFGAVLVLLIIINVREIRQEEAKKRAEAKLRQGAMQK